MRFCTIIIAPIFLLSLFSCATTGSVDGIWTTRDSGLPSSVNKRVNHFGPGEIPAVIIGGYEGQNVHFEISDIKSGRILQSDTVYRTLGHLYVGQWQNAPDGTYIARLKVHGAIVDSYTFTVVREPESDSTNSQRTIPKESNLYPILEKASKDGLAIAYEVDEKRIVTKVFYLGDKIRIFWKNAGNTELILLDLKSNLELASIKEDKADDDPEKINVEYLIPVTWIRDRANDHHLETSGTKEYAFETRLLNSGSRYAFMTFFINYDITAKDVRK